jgi:acylphosphatase
MSQQPNPVPERREIFFSGRVQGVGFRATAHALARRFGVVGFVRNLPDGRVELVAEGTPEMLDRLLAAIDGELGQFIRSSQANTLPYRGEFSDFAIHR